MEEKDYFDGIVPGKLYACSDGGITEYREKRCPFTSSFCSVKCELFENGRCQYRTSLRGEMYRELDNKVMFFTQSPELIPSFKTKVEKSTLVVGVEAQGSDSVKHPNDSLESPSPPTNSAEEIETLVDNLTVLRFPVGTDEQKNKVRKNGSM